MSNFDPHSYSVLTRRVLEDGETLFKATVKELPHVAEFGDSPAKVYALAIDAIEGLHKMAADMGHEFPTPVVKEEDFSGRVTLRMPKTLHRLVASTAEAEGVSTNHFLVTAITACVTAGNMYTALTRRIGTSLFVSGKIYLVRSGAPIVHKDIEWHHHASPEIYNIPENTIIEVQETAGTPEYEVPVCLLSNH